MSRYRYGDLMWVDHDPSAGHEQNKRRPAVVVTNDDYNRYNNLVMVVSITTSDRRYPLHIDIGRIPTEDGGEIHGWAEIEQAKCLDLDARNASVVGSLDEETMNAISSMLVPGLLTPTMTLGSLI